MLERLDDLEDLEMLNEMRSRPLEFSKLDDFIRLPSEETDASAAPSFASRWRGKFKVAEHEDARYDALSEKYIR